MEQTDALSPAGRIIDESFDRNFTQHSVLCILLLEHRLAYAVYDEDKRKFTVNHTIYLEAGQDSATFLDTVRSLIAKEDILHLPFQSVLIGVGSATSVLLPEDQAATLPIGTLLDLAAEPAKENVLFRDGLIPLQARMEYGIHRGLSEYLQNTFVHCSLYHSNTALLLGLERERPDRGTVVYLFVLRHSFSLCVFRDGTLHFFNTFHFRSTEDFLYFVLLVCDQLELDREQTPFVLLGEIMKESAIFNTLQGYLGNVQFGRRPRGFRYNREIRELPGQFFYNLFALPLCAS